MFRGLTIDEGWRHTLKLIYVVDGQQMERSDTYQERVRMCGVVCVWNVAGFSPPCFTVMNRTQVYRELHGVLGEGKGHFEEGLAVALFLVNATSTEAATQRLKVPHCCHHPAHPPRGSVRLTRHVCQLPRFVEPGHMCPYYAGPVYFVVTRFNLQGSETAGNNATPPFW
jgi:hypothetical protein